MDGVPAGLTCSKSTFSSADSALSGEILQESGAGSSAL